MKPTSNDAASTSTVENVTNPFCGTLPDDLQVTVTDNLLTVTNNDCPITKAGFEKKLPAKLTPQVNGKDVDLDVAISEAAKLIKKSSNTLFAGLGTDVSGNRSILQTADKVGGTVDHMLTDAVLRNVLALSDHGWILSTFTEIRNRADLIVFVGCDATDHSRFYERIIWPEESLFVEPDAREVAYLGKKLNTKAGISPKGKKPTSIPCDLPAIPEVMNAFNAILERTPLQAKKVGGATIANLQKLADKVTAAEYPVFIWSSSKLDFPNAELAVSAISNVVRTLNKTQRAAGCYLGGGEGVATSMAVSTWQTGYPFRVSFAKGYPEYNPTRFSTEQILSSNQAEALVWVSTLTPDKLPPETNIPTIVIGEPGMKLKSAPDVFIPAGTPGIDHTGLMVRVDAVVSLPVKKLRDIGLPSVAHIFDKIYQNL